MPLQRRGHIVGVETFKPDRDDVLRAISEGSNDVIFLNSESEYAPEAQISKYKSKETWIPDDLFRFNPLSRISSVFCHTKQHESVLKSVQVSSVEVKQRHSGVSADRVSQIFGCGIEAAKETLRVTTQHGVRSAVRPLQRRYRTDLLSLNYRRLNKQFYCDMMFIVGQHLRWDLHVNGLCQGLSNALQGAYGQYSSVPCSRRWYSKQVAQ